VIRKKIQYLVALVSLAIVLFGYGVYELGNFASSREMKAGTPAPSYSKLVVYTAEGYSPAVLEVSLGSKVGFKNTSDFPMWTASDPHPLHSDYGDFDSRRDYLAGETYVYEFKETGTFGYHNHEKSLHRGIVRVYDPANPAVNIDKAKESQRATRDKYLAMLDQNNPDSVFTMINAIEANGALARDCHDISHDLGHKAYEMFGFSTAMTFNNEERLAHTSVDDLCAGGYMHGILEELFLHRPHLKNDPAAICAPVPEESKESCFHGVGHGLMFVNKRDIPASLTTCRGIGKPYYSRCFEGVWMEMFWGDTGHAGADSLGWETGAPLEPCKNAKIDEKPACFLYAHLGYLREHPRDFAGAIDICTKNRLDYSDTGFCLKGVGITLMKHFTSSNLERTEQLVTSLTTKQKYSFYEGVVGYARLSGVTEQSLKSFCNRLQTDTVTCLSVMKNTPR
jgi:hypothetical protein